jgi:putative ABC transport system permease protein
VSGSSGGRTHRARADGYGSLFTHTLRGQGLDRLSVPSGQAVTFLVLAAIVGVLAARWPGIRAARTRPLEAIADT